MARSFDDPYIRSTALIGFAELVGERDDIHLNLLRDAGLPEEGLTNTEMMISYAAFGTLMELAAKRLDRPSLGLEWAMQSGPEFPDLGPVVFLSHFSSTLSEWLTISLKYWKHHTNAITVKPVVDPHADTMRMRYVALPHVYPNRQIVEHSLATLVMLARNAVEPRALNLKTVRFRHTAPPEVSFHEAVFQCPIEFNALHDEVVFARDLINMPTSGNLRFFRSLVDVYMKVRSRALPRQERPMEASVALVISSVIGTQKCTVDEVAALLGVSPKKLQRLLAHEGTSFSDILDRAREIIARQLLLESDLPVSSIAGLLDYSSPSSFILAFKRWTNDTPLAYRKAERNKRDGE